MNLAPSEHPPAVSRRPRRRRARLAAALVATTTVATLFTAPAVAASAEDADLASRFTLAVLPDTQFYSRYSADQFMPRYGSDPFATQTEWLAEHRDELNIPFVTHLGDVVDRVGTEAEWVAADNAITTLDDDGLPYSILAGNHDVLNSADNWFDTDYDLSKEPFLRWFGPTRAADVSTYGGSDPTGFNQFHVFEAAGQEFLVLALSWRASDATLAWAQQVLDVHPTLPVILTTHSLLNVEPDTVTPKEDAYGARLWEELIRGNDQIFLTFNGHFHGSAQLTRVNDAGHSVTNVLMDYQMAYEGGNGYLGLLEFDLSNNRISVQTASPWVVDKPSEALTSYDQPFLEGPNQQFVLDVDFAERFAGFAPEFGPGAADQPSLTQRARDILLDGFEGPDPIDLEQPGSREDFVPVDGTLAHWRFGDTPGVVQEGQVFEDIAGDADLHRVAIAESGSPTATVGDVTVSTDANPFSADGGAVCFADSDKTTGRFSYLQTAADAAVNDARLENGYTVETFLKIDGSWTADQNGWMKAITRSGNRSTIPGMPWSRWDYTASPAALGLSNLKEFQWTEVPVETTKGDRTSWSGEIILDRWVHVALVNDPETSRTTMYVDGAPVLRNATDTLGQSLNGDMPWVFGADWVDDRALNGWAGCIGETRVVDHPTTPEQWLTARPDLGSFSTTAPSGELPAGTVVDELSGTGTPNATVALGGDLAGSAVVGADGTWSIPLGDAVGTTAASGAGAARRAAAVIGPLRSALEPGNYSFELRQGFGTRVSDPVTGSFSIAAAPVEPGTGGGNGNPGGNADSGQAGTGTGEGLASTGFDGALLAGLAAALMAIGAIVVVARRKRGRARAGDVSS